MTCKRLLLANIAILSFAAFASSCADLGDSSSETLTKSAAWLAFLDAHRDIGPGGSLGSTPADPKPVFAGPAPSLVLHQTEADKQHRSELEKLRYPKPGDYTVSRSDDEIIAASGDQDLINLHNRMKQLYETLGWATLPVYSNLNNLNGQRVKYHTDTASTYAAMPNTEGMTPFEAHQVEEEYRKQSQARAQGEVAEQSDAGIKHSISSAREGQKQFLVLRKKMAIPMADLVAVMRKYVPPGSTGWNCTLENAYDSTGIVITGAQYGTWTY